MKLLRTLFLAFSSVALVSGCAQVPKESVELSATLGRDLQEVQKSHRRAVDLLFDRDVERISNYINNVATPAYISGAMNGVGPLLAKSLDEATKPTATEEQKHKAYGQIEKVIKAVTERLAKERKDLLEPLEARRKETLMELDRTYAELQRANAVVTAHLSSVVKVHSVQDELLSKVGLKDFREKLGDEALRANAQVTAAISDGEQVEAVLTKLKKAIAELKQ
jgi:hypothetical protein